MSSRYIWAHALSTQLRGRGYASINDTTDEAIASARNVSGAVYQIAQYIAAFNTAMVFPDLMRVDAPPPDADFSGVNAINVADVLSRANPQLWRAVVAMYKVLRGSAHLCNDAEFSAVFDSVNGAQVGSPVAVVFQGVLATVAAKLPPSTVSLQMGLPFAGQGLAAQNAGPAIPTHVEFAELANDDAVAVSVSAVRARDPVSGAVAKSYVARMRLDGSGGFAGGGGGSKGMIHVGMQTMINADPYQYVMFAALTNQLAGATCLVDASQVQGIGGAPGEGVSFVHLGWNGASAGAGQPAYFGMKINKVLGAAVSDGLVLSLKLEVQDMASSAGACSLDGVQLPELEAPGGADSAMDVIMASADPKVAVKFVMQLTGLVTA